MFDLPLSKDTTKATFVFWRKVVYVMPVFIAFRKCGATKFEGSFTSLGGIASVPRAFLYLYFKISFLII